MQVWRICPEKYVTAAFSGEGSRRFSARWNPAGIPMVYASLSLSLAAIEVFVHLAAVPPGDLVSVTAELPLNHRDAERIDPETLPTDWRMENNPALWQIGAEWVSSRRSLVLLVPSAVIDGEWNALINPTHPAAAAIKVGVPKPFHFDSRMFRER